MGSHFGYIAASYGFTALVLGILLVWSLVQYRAARRALEALESSLKRKG